MADTAGRLCRMGPSLAALRATLSLCIVQAAPSFTRTELKWQRVHLILILKSFCLGLHFNQDKLKHYNKRLKLTALNSEP